MPGRQIVITDEQVREMVADIISGLRSLGMSDDGIARRIDADPESVSLWHQGLAYPSTPYWLRLESLVNSIVYR